MLLKLPRLLTFLFFTIPFYLVGQVGIGTTNIDNGVALEIDSPNSGILIPRIALLSDADNTTIPGILTNGTLIYNTTTNSTLTEGFYSWYNTSWVKLSDINLSKDNLTQASETRNYDMNGEVLNFTNGSFGINSNSNTTIFEAISNSNLNAFSFYQGNNLTSEKDVFTIEDADIGGGGQDGSSVLKIHKSGSINSGDDGFSLIELTNSGTDPGADKYWISGRKIDEGAPLWGVDITDSEYWSEGGIVLGVTPNTDGTYTGGNFIVQPNGNTGVGTTNPQKEIHVAGTTSTIRIDGLNNANNINNIAADPVPVYVDNNGDLTTQPPLIQNFMPLNLRNFTNAVTITSNSGASVDTNLNTSTITLTQRSLVNYSYQFSVAINALGGGPITDGASRLFRAWFTVNGDNANHYGYDTGTYTNNPETTSTGGTYASGYYYLSGNGYVELPAGTHTFTLTARGFGGSFGFEMTFGDTTYDSIQAIVHR